MVTDEQVISALRKLGPSAPTALANHLQAEPHVVGHRLREMLKAKKLAGAGNGRGRKYALPDQKLEVAQTPPRRKHKPAAKGKHSRRGASRTRAARKAAAAAPFTTAITADFRLVCISDTGVHVFSEKQTEDIAEVITANFRT